MQSKREFEYDVMRAIAAIAVVCIHTCSMQGKEIDILSFQRTVLTGCCVLCFFSVPLFLMISGRFLLDRNKPLNIKDVLLHRLPKIAVAFCAWSFIYMIQNIFLTDSFTDNWKSIVFEFVIGKYHMWYLWSIAAMYLITPLLRTIASDDKLSKYFLFLFFVFQLLLPAMSNVPHIGMFAAEILNKSKMQFVMGFSGYYLLGYYIAEHPFSSKARGCCYVLGLAGAVYSVIAVLHSSRSLGEVDITLAGYLTWNVAAETVAVYVLVSQLFKGKSSKVISIFAKYSFGIYLSHPLILCIFSLIGFMPDFINPVLGIPIVTFSALVLSLIISVILRKIPKFGKLIT